jgi:tetratricopeptide (TPR) repeat protein
MNGYLFATLILSWRAGPMRCRVAALALSLLLPLAVRAEEPPLQKLRQDLAEHYVQPEPHMALAHSYHAKGNRLQAFLLLEYARRSLFPREQFDEVFERAFLQAEPFDNSKAAEAALLKKLGRDPTAAKIAIKLADIYISREDWPRAKEYLGKVITLEPEDFSNVEALAEVLRREGKPKEAAQAVADYLTKHPRSREAYHRKLAPLMRTDAQAAKKLLTKAVAAFPQDGRFLFNQGVLLQNEDRLKEAEEHFVKAAALAKDSAHIQGWTGRFFLKVRPDEGKALHYYLSAYFLDPHFYDSEHAEQRIWKLSTGAAQKRYQGLVTAGKRPAEILRDSNPLVVGMALDTMGKQWDRGYSQSVLAALGHDDEYVRAKALRALLAHVDRSFDKDLKGLLQDADLRKRGMAAYLAVNLWGEEGIKAVKPWLKAEVQLLRYDALSALLQHGGEEGRKLVRQHRRQEQHPWLKRWLAALDKQD